MSGAHAHQHGHGHAHGCAADHHRGEYTERQQADLDLVLAFNHRLTVAVEECIDITGTIAALEPDPLRYMWVDEGDGQIPAQLEKAAAVLDVAPRLVGQARGTAAVLSGSRNAARPSVATRGATTLVGWLEWQEGRGDRLVAALDGRTTTVVEGPEDLFRPTAAVTADGTPWLLFGRSVDARVGVWACRFSERLLERTGAGEHAPTDRRSTRRCSPIPTGACTWPGRAASTTGSGSSPGAGRTAAWAEPVWVSEGVASNVWDPTLTADWRRHGLRLVRVLRGQLRRRAAPDRLPTAWPARSAGSPVAATTRCTPAWPRPPTAGCGARST